MMQIRIGEISRFIKETMSEKTTRILVVIVTIFLVVVIATNLPRSSVAQNPVFWTAVAIEILLGLFIGIFYDQVRKRYLTKRPYRLLNFFAFFLTLFGFLAPIILGYTIEYLKPIGGAWTFFFLTIGLKGIYKIIKKEPLTQQDAVEIQAKIIPSVSKVFHLITLAGILAMLITVIYFSIVDSAPIAVEDKVRGVSIFIVCLIFLPIGWFLPRIINRNWKGERSDFFVYFIYSLYPSVFITVATMGLILGIVNGLVYLSLPLIILAGISTALNFPTKERWERWKTGR
jgi:hypothetical protein